MMRKGCLACVLLIAAALSWGQTGTGTIQGIVKDATGAVIPHARITIVHAETARQNKTEANDVGFYLLPSIQVGAYEFSVEAPGMETWKGNLNLAAGQTAAVDPALKLATTATAVTVAGDVTPLVTTTSPTVATVVERERIEQLPIN